MRSIIAYHLYKYEFQFDYTIWDQHGEFRETLSTDMEFDEFMERGPSSLVQPMTNIVFKVVGPNESASKIPNRDAQFFLQIITISQRI